MVACSLVRPLVSLPDLIRSCLSLRAQLYPRDLSLPGESSPSLSVRLSFALQEEAEEA